MHLEERKDYINAAFRRAVGDGLCRTVSQFAELVGVDRSSISMALGGSEKHCTEAMVKKVQRWESQASDLKQQEADTVLLLPWEAKGGLIGDFVDGIERYQCERIVSPIRGADYAIQVTGDSMSPEYPSGSVVLIKQINEDIFVEWGKVYVLDTPNGAVMKQIRKTADPEVIECISINPAYQPFTLECKYITRWFKVLMVMAAK
jgi:SOS-response transcriptional repressor LexA